MVSGHFSEVVLRRIVCPPPFPHLTSAQWEASPPKGQPRLHAFGSTPFLFFSHMIGSYLFPNPFSQGYWCSCLDSSTVLGGDVKGLVLWIRFDSGSGLFCGFYSHPPIFVGAWTATGAYVQRCWVWLDRWIDRWIDTVEIYNRRDSGLRASIILAVAKAGPHLSRCKSREKETTAEKFKRPSLFGKGFPEQFSAICKEVIQRLL